MKNRGFQGRNGGIIDIHMRISDLRAPPVIIDGLKWCSASLTVSYCTLVSLVVRLGAHCGSLYGLENLRALSSLEW